MDNLLNYIPHIQINNEKILDSIPYGCIQKYGILLCRKMFNIKRRFQKSRSGTSVNPDNRKSNLHFNNVLNIPL